MELTMRKLLIPGLLLILFALCIPACSGGLASGNLIGTVVRDGTGDTIPFPVLVIGKVLKSPTTPDQMIKGDKDGKFQITVPGGNYTVQIGSNEQGPFYMYPEPVYIEENQTKVALFSIPEGY